MSNFLTLESLGSFCRIQGDSELIRKISEDDFTYHYIPNSKKVYSEEPDIKIFQKRNMEELVSIDYPLCNFKEDLSPRDVVSLGEYLLERERQERNSYYSLSSATANKGDNAVIFFGGATNLGKTSSMLELIQSYSYEFFSDEKTVIDLENKTIVGGSRSIPTRKNIIKEKVNAKDNDSFQKLNHGDLGIKQVSLLIYPHIDNGLQDPIFYQFKALDFHWILTREFSVMIRGAIRLVDNFSYPVPSIDTLELSKLRVKRTQKFAKEVPCFYYQGSTKQIAKFVDDFLRC